MPLHRRNRISRVILCFILAAFCAVPLYASEIDEKIKELQEINAAIDKFEKLYEQKQKEEKKALGDIKTLEVNIDSLEADIAVLERKIAATEQQLTLTQQEIDQATARVKERNDYLDQRLRSMYMEGNIGWLEVLLASTSLTDFLTRFDLLEKIAQNDAALLQELTAARRSLLEKQIQLQDIKRQFHYLKEQNVNKQDQLKIQSRQKATMLKSIQEQKEEYRKALDELDEVQQQLDDFIREWQAAHAQAYMGVGAMAWPVPGSYTITSGYEERYHPIVKERRFHNAIDIRAARGAPIVAAENGTVIFRGTKAAYGRAVILDHGGGISTQYSHLLSFAPECQLGARVKKGQVIAYADSTGWSTGNHLDFMVRKNGEPQNPLNYVRPK